MCACVSAFLQYYNRYLTIVIVTMKYIQFKSFEFFLCVERYRFRPLHFDYKIDDKNPCYVYIVSMLPSQTETITTTNASIQTQLYEQVDKKTSS